MLRILLQFSQFVTKRKVLVSHAFALCIGLLMADVVHLYIKHFLNAKISSPKKRTPSKIGTKTKSYSRKGKSYQKTLSRNLFSHEGFIPAPIAPESSLSTLEQQAVPSTLPIKLIGTIVYTQPEMSLATLQGHGNNRESTFRVGENITSQARLVYVVRDKIFIDNLENKKIEFITAEEFSSSLSFTPKSSRQSPSRRSGGGSPSSAVSSSSKSASKSYSKLSQQISKNKFKISRGELLKHTKNLGQLLKQAKAVPNKGSNGKINGFKLVYIKPNSAFTALGLKKNDVIHAVNGKEITSPAQAMELYQKLQTSDYLELTLGRNNQKEKLSFNIQP